MKKIFSILILSSLFIQTSCLKDDDSPIAIDPILGTTIEPEVGGPAQPNQVWIDLSSHTETKNVRTDWDLGFSTGEEFRVILNNSILMAAAEIESNDIDAVNQSNFNSLINIIDITAGFPGEYIDNVAGDYFNNGTAIKEISANDADNKVYLLKMGYELYLGNDIPNNSAYTAGDSRGYKKVRILRNGNDGYKIQYADLNDTTHKEFIVTKDPEYHFTYFSFDLEDVVKIQPKKNNWDLCFTVFNNVIEGHGTYIYADYIVSNHLSGVGIYQVDTDHATLTQDYNNFTINDVDESLFEYNDQRSLGGNWRSTVSGTSSTPVVHGDRFFVLKDPDGIMYKIRFISMTKDGQRGYPVFEFDPL